ncbi:MAG TPA: hypothetical protein VJL83_04680 [Patescibacteria group bacterium]|nr:hypothetical protein [Patescibacteria group bacterium]
MANPDIFSGRYDLYPSPQDGQWVRVGDYLVFVRPDQIVNTPDPSQGRRNTVQYGDYEILRNNPYEEILIPNQDIPIPATHYQIPHHETHDDRNNRSPLTEDFSLEDYLSKHR